MQIRRIATIVAVVTALTLLMAAGYTLAGPERPDYDVRHQ